MGIDATLPTARGLMPAAQGSSELLWAPPCLFCWDGEMRESVSCRAAWVLSFPGSLLGGFPLPPNPHFGGGGSVVGVVRSS